MNWKRSIYSLSIVLLVMGTALAGSTEDFKAANTLFDAGKFSEATTAYERIEPKTAAVYFNLGNAYFRLNQFGRAVLNYERARRLEPNDPDIAANLRFTEDRLGVTEANQAAGSFLRYWKAFTEGQTVRQWSFYEIGGIWLLVLFIAGAIWRPKWRTGFIVLAMVTGGGFLGVTAALGNRVFTDNHRQQGVILVGKAEARFAPLVDGTVHFQLGEGTILVILEEREAWVLVERADGQQGWVRSDAVARVVLK